MARKEKFGKFVLLEEVETSGLGHEYRAAKLSASGLEKIVSVLRLKPSLSANAEAAKSLMEQVKFAAQLQNPNILKMFGIGKVDAAYYVCSEFLEGKSLKAIFHRTRQDGFPFSIDHTLLIASKVCTALEHAHARKTEGGVRYFHGFINPSSVIVSYEGEVRLRGFGVWPSRMREAGGSLPEEDGYLSPEQVAGAFGDTRSDTWAVGTLLFETLSGQVFVQDGRRDNPAGRLAQARMQSPAADDDALPKPVSDILHKALAADPGARYGEVQEMRKAVDTLLFSGDFTPTTFNLAFFMHSLFREDIDREARALKEEKDASYLEFLVDEPARPATAAVGVAPGVAATAAVATTVPVWRPAAPLPRPEASPPPERAARTEPPRPEPPLEPRVAAFPPLVDQPLRDIVPPPAPVVRHEPAPVGLSAREAAAGLTFHRPAAPGSRRPLVVVGLAALLLIGATAGYLGVRGRPVPASAEPTETVPTTLNPEAAAALARVKELEEKLKAIEAEKAVSEARAAEDARKKVEAQAAATGRAADPAAIARAQAEARHRAQEQDRRLREEQQRLEAERQAAEERLAEQRRKEEEEAAQAAAIAAAATTTTTTTLPAPPPTTTAPVPALSPGTLVNLSDPGVIAPVLDRAASLAYPPIALRQRLEGTVALNALVDEKGNVVDTQIVAAAGGKSGLNEAAVESVKRRKYRPATKDGVPVKVWLPVRVQFKLP